MAEVLTDQIDLNVRATPNPPALEPEHHVNPIHLSWSKDLWALKNYCSLL